MSDLPDRDLLRAAAWEAYRAWCAMPPTSPLTPLPDVITDAIIAALTNGDSND